MNEMEKRVKHSISNIQRSVKAYVFDKDDSAYLTVAVELRKLLLDNNAAESFIKKERGKKNNKRNLFEIYCGTNGKNIYLKSFLRDSKNTKRAEAKSHISVTPNIYESRIDILCEAIHGSNGLVRLPN